MDAEQIVRALDRESAPVCEGDPLSYPRCLFCEADEVVYDRPYAMFPEDVVQAHKPDCPWRMAREWVAANPA